MQEIDQKSRKIVENHWKLRENLIKMIITKKIDLKSQKYLKIVKNSIKSAENQSDIMKSCRKPGKNSTEIG